MNHDQQHMIGMEDAAGYLQRMRDGLHDKLRVERYLPPEAHDVLDVGCADGTLTLAIAAHHPSITFLGVDLDAGFVSLAREQQQATGLRNARFQQVYLRELLARPQRFDAILFASVLHEFFTYGEGISSVVKALADAHELLRPGGMIVVRDMILGSYARTATLRVAGMRARVQDGSYARTLAEFEQQWGQITTLSQLNHFALKYRYQENWARELPENYIGVSAEQYLQMFALLGLQVESHDVYLLPYLREHWAAELGFDDDDLNLLRSTTLLVARKAENLTPAD